MKIKRLVAETWPPLNRRIKMMVSKSFLSMVGLCTESYIIIDNS